MRLPEKMQEIANEVLANKKNEKAKNRVAWRQLVEQAKVHTRLYSQVFSSVQFTTKSVCWKN
jgi:hypothetical protein